MMLTIRLSIAFMALAACLARAQSPAGAPVFEVASVKPSTAPASHGSSISTGAGGRFTTENVRLRRLITFAYDLRDHQLTGGPGWMDDDGFDIIAKPDREVPRGPEGSATLRLMLQALLADRFHLTLHRETRELPVYALVVNKNGPRLTESGPESKGPGISSGAAMVQATKATMDLFARVLSNKLGRTVIDKTGLTANYDFKLEFAPDPGPAMEKSDAPPPDRPTIFTALQEQLGLRLEAQRAPVEIIVVDHAEKPSEN